MESLLFCTTSENLNEHLLENSVIAVVEWEQEFRGSTNSEKRPFSDLWSPLIQVV